METHTSEHAAQFRTVTEWIKPFTFKIRLATDVVIICGLVRSYFSRMLPEQAFEQLRKDGPHVGDQVSLLVSDDAKGGMRKGVILGSRE